MLALIGGVLGFVVSVPPTGPVALLILERALRGDHRGGWLLGLGSTAADLPYIALGALGYGTILERDPDLGAGFDLLGALILAAIAARLARAPVDPPEASEARRGGDLAAGLALGLANPTRLLTWTVAASLAGDRMVGAGPEALAAWTLGAALGQILWWTILLSGWRRWGDRISVALRARVIRWIAIGAALLAILLAVRSLSTLSASSP